MTEELNKKTVLIAEIVMAVILIWVLSSHPVYYWPNIGATFFIGFMMGALLMGVSND